MSSRFFFKLGLWLMMLGCKNLSTSYQPQNLPQVPEFSSKDNVWIFIMAGQSNMAGRAVIEDQDKVQYDRILSVKKGQVGVAKEPLHWYEPHAAGLDCGMSFGIEMLKTVPDDVSILLVPTAVGGSSITQWINDEIHRDVKLLSNLKHKLQVALDYGVLKGIIWHQGESDAHNEENIESYQQNMAILFNRFRTIGGNDSIPIVAGKLGSFAVNQEGWDRINKSIVAYSLIDDSCEVVETSDLEDKGDKIHFNSEAQRILGKRYAQSMLKFLNC